MKLTDAEWQIMNALWQGYPATARQVGGRLGGEVSWAYTTIKTMLSRLVDKKVVSEAKQGNTSVYEPIVSRSRARSKALRTLVDQAFDGAFGPMLHFLVEDQKLSEKERQQLLKVLRTNNSRKGGRK